ncbi:hypothetical protein M9458_051864 [Cirrhinus mrigala]|uniref:DDE Tnp4 domain-containing protein n=1 Tax=Cirrhinus mrigala TaxID=683832 RepID=A0ABD0MS40_CIRMR
MLRQARCFGAAVVAATTKRHACLNISHRLRSDRSSRLPQHLSPVAPGSTSLTVYTPIDVYKPTETVTGREASPFSGGGGIWRWQQWQDFVAAAPATQRFYSLSICLRYLATGDSFRTIAFSYRVGHSTVAGIVQDVASAIWEVLVEDTMPVPKKEDWRAIADQFYARWNFPNCLGAIDGKHVLLAVVDANYLFRVVDVGGYGRTSDGGTLRNSAFGESLRDGTLDLPPDAAIPGAEHRGPLPCVFVGDEAFPLTTNLLRPYPGHHIPPERRAFNYRLSRARLVVECAFGILSARWRMYRRVIATSPKVAEACVLATCVLHNFLRKKMLEGRRCTPTAAPANEAPSAPEGLRDAPRMGSNNASRRAIQLRDTYCTYFSQEGAVPWQPSA